MNTKIVATMLVSFMLLAMVGGAFATAPNPQGDLYKCPYCSETKNTATAMQNHIEHSHCKEVVIIHDGPQGPKGDKGAVGPQGPQGKQGLQGLPGADAIVNYCKIFQYIDMKINYEMAKVWCYVKKHAVPGPEGPQGIPGTNGTNGINGTDGVNGTNGIDGTNGTDGVNGTNGKDGLNGTITTIEKIVTGNAVDVPMETTGVPVAPLGVAIVYILGGLGLARWRGLI